MGLKDEYYFLSDKKFARINVFKLVANTIHLLHLSTTDFEIYKLTQEFHNSFFF